MASLLIGSIPESLFERLKTRAAANGRSVREEVLAILSKALKHEQLDSRLTLTEIRHRRVRTRRPLTDAFIRRARREGRL